MVPNLFVGDPNTSFSEVYDFRNLPLFGNSTSAYTSKYPSGDTKATDSYAGDYITGEASCECIAFMQSMLHTDGLVTGSTSNTLSYSGNTITINGSSSVSLRWLWETGVKIGSANITKTREDEK